MAERSLDVEGMTWSPIKGPEGNIEFWVVAAFGTGTTDVEPRPVVVAAHEALGG